MSVIVGVKKLMEVVLMVHIDWNLEKSVIENLSKHLGVDLREIIDDMPPEESLTVGDRVLYLYHGEDYKRRDPDAGTMKSFLDDLTKRLDEEVGEGQYSIDFEIPQAPAEESEARMIDIMPAFTWWSERIKYARSPNPLPSEDWRVEWLLGVLFLSEDAEMIYLDFRNPKVKVVVAGCFYSMYDPNEVNNKRKEMIVKSLRRARELKRRYRSESSINWVKLVFTPDREGKNITIITTMDQTGKLNTQESQTEGEK